jgi:hypothetical protein
MTKLFSLLSFRLLTLGGAKACTNGGDGSEEEEVELFYIPG